MAEDQNVRQAVDKMAQRFVKQSESDAQRGLRPRPLTHQEARRKVLPIAARHDRRK